MLETICLDTQGGRFAVSDNLIRMNTGGETTHRQFNAAIPESSLFPARTTSLSTERDHSNDDKNLQPDLPSTSPSRATKISEAQLSHQGAALTSSGALNLSIGQGLSGTSNLPTGRGFLEAASGTFSPSMDQGHLEVDSYPTDARERAKEREKQIEKDTGVKPVKKVKVKIVEDHRDDCGNDISSLEALLPGSVASTVNLISELPLWCVTSNYQSFFTDDAEYEEHYLFDRYPLFICIGNDDVAKFQHIESIHLHIREALTLLATLPTDLDICELCGGEARTSRLAIRRQLAVGKNFDLVCGVDLNSDHDQMYTEQYVKKHKPFIIVMAPTCTPYGKLANLNFKIHFDGWYRTWQNTFPHARFCGRIAKLQLQEGRHFFREQPQGSHMDEEPPWPEVIADPRVVRTTVDQCAFGQVVNGLPAKKPTDCMASHPLLLSNFEGMRCRGCPVHANLENGQCNKAKVWPWAFSRALVNGICALKRYEQGHRALLVHNNVDSMYDYVYPVTEDVQTKACLLYTSDAADE